MKREDYASLSESEYKLLANICASHKNERGIAKLPYDGDGFKSVEERYYGYVNLSNKGYILFDPARFKKGSHINYADITLTTNCD